MSAITTHILDAVLGAPASGIAIHLEHQPNGSWTTLSRSFTDHDGRCHDLCPNAIAGAYRLTFSVGDYFASRDRISIYPEITITFIVSGDRHFHIPLLLSDNSYTTYRGT